MAKEPKNHGKAWSKDDVANLKKLASENTPTPIIAMKLDRTPISVKSKANIENVSLKPTNQSPYNRKKK